MATTYYKRIFSVTPADIRFSRKGEIFIFGQKVGDWSVSYPRKENSAKGFKGRGYRFTERFYSFGFPYRGSWSAYSKKEMIERIVSFIENNGLDIVDKERK